MEKDSGAQRVSVAVVDRGAGSSSLSSLVSPQNKSYSSDEDKEESIFPGPACRKEGD